jgi:glycosyltransferase involved in cell wall biosynthesis
LGALVLDVRANGNTGIARYGHRLLIESRSPLESLGRKVYAVVRHRDLPWLRPWFESSTVELIAPPTEDGGRFLQPGVWLEDFVADIQPDMFYTTNYTMDHRYSGPFVFTVHDLIRLVLPAASSDEEFIARYGAAEFQRLREQAAAMNPASTAAGQVFGQHFEALTRTLAAKATRVATVSAASAADIVSVLGVAPERISIVPSAVDEVFQPRAASVVNEMRERLSVGERYFLYVGLAGTHKRVDWLIGQFLGAARYCPPDTRLVIVGGDAEQRTDIQRALALAERPGQVVFTGRITDDDVVSLYTGAMAYLSASAAEGFGLPPAEAMACGTESIVTDIPAHREVLGRHAHYYAADGAGFRRLVVDAAHGRLSARSPGFAPPTWQRAAAEFMRTIREALEPL